MKYSFVALALVAAAQAQTRADIPECAISCLDNAIESETKCDVKDYVCVCENFSKVRSIATTCVIKECGADVAVNEVLPATEALCENPKDESGGSGEETTAAPATTATTGATTVAAETSTVAETTVVADETSAVEEGTTTVAPVVSTPDVQTTVVVQPPVTPNATTGAPPQETTTDVVVDNGAAALSGLGGIAMLAFAAFAL